ESVDCHGCNDGTVDATGEAEHDLAETILVDVIAQAENASEPGGFVSAGQFGDLSPGTGPAIVAAQPVRDNEIGGEGLALEDQLVARLDAEGGAIKDQFI